MKDKDNNTNKSYWNNIYDRLEACREKLDKCFTPSQKEKTAILQNRAKTCAQEDKKIKEGEEYLQVVEFLLADEKYALELDLVLEVYPVKEITQVPCTPSFVAGIINFRGQILSIIDLKKFYAFPNNKINNQKHTIILHSKDMEFGILADAIVGVNVIPKEILQTTLPTLTDVQAEHLKGITQERVVVLDGEKMLSDKKFQVKGELK